MPLRSVGLIFLVGMAVVAGCASAPTQRPGAAASTWCTPSPAGLPGGAYVAVFTGGLGYQPRGAVETIQLSRNVFRDRLLAALAGSPLSISVAEGQRPDLDFHASLHNDGSDNFFAVITVRGSQSVLFEYRQPYTYTSATRALEDAAVTVAGLLRNGWVCS